MNNPAALKNIRVVLARPRHPGNIGATARAMKTMGLSVLRLVNPEKFPHDEATARASGASDVLEGAQLFSDLKTALGDCVLAVATSSRHRELRHDAVNARDAAREIVGAASHHPVAVVFGNETSGLSSEEANLCQLWATIPANTEYASLNLAAAVQIFTYEIRMAAGLQAPAVEPEFAPATVEQVEQLYEHLVHTMTTVGFHDPANPKRLLPRLRRMLARARLETEEVTLLRGFLKAIGKHPSD